MRRNTAIVVIVAVAMLAWAAGDQQRQIDALRNELVGLAESTAKVLDLRQRQLEGTGDD